MNDKDTQGFTGLPEQSIAGLYSSFVFVGAVVAYALMIIAGIILLAYWH